MRIGILTGGGDCPGLNAAIRAAVRQGERTYGDELIGFCDGWRGLMEDRAIALDVAACRGSLPRGGTILGTSPTDPYSHDLGAAQVRQTLERRRVHALVVIGGRATLAIANRLGGEGVDIVGIPKAIDNDLGATEVSIGFHSAVQTATDAIDRLHTTAESHDRVLVCEVRGRHAGWIATYAGIAGGAAEIVVPEEPFDVEQICERLRRRRAAGHFASIVVIAEGANPRVVDPGPDNEKPKTVAGRGGIGQVLADQIEQRTRLETRVTVIGHLQRGGSPIAFDRVLATRFGIAAMDAVHDHAFGQMVVLRNDRVVRAPLSTVTGPPRAVDTGLLQDVGRVFVG
ncbi:MAG: ATP-dependent 6-phosphofructokinase [Acidimicrobiales bacterium]